MQPILEINIVWRELGQDIRHTSIVDHGILPEDPLEQTILLAAREYMLRNYLGMLDAQIARLHQEATALAEQRDQARTIRRTIQDAQQAAIVMPEHNEIAQPQQDVVR